MIMKRFILVALIAFLSIKNVNADTSNNKPIVVISEIFYDSPLNEQIGKGIPYSNGEYIELYNAGSVSADITGWSITGGSSTEKYVFSATTIIPANGYIILAYRYSSSFYLPFGEVLPLKRIVYQKKIILNNDGETISLIDKTGSVQDYIHYNGTANLTQIDRLSATNEDGLDWSLCQSLHRINVVLDADGKCIPSNADWVTDYISPFEMKLNSSDITSGSFGGQNYVRTEIFVDTMKFVPSPGSGLYQARTEITYYDGLGYPEKKVQCEFAPDGRDWVTLQEYDLFKRPTKSWLPQVASTNGGVYENTVDFCAQNQAIYADQYPYTEDIFDINGRKLEHFGAGERWRANLSSEKTAYFVNDNSLQCCNFEVSGRGINSSLEYLSYVKNGLLSVVRTQNEDGVDAYEFKDVLGRTLLQRTRLVEAGQTKDYDTYFVYDERDNLCYVLPPSIPHSGLCDYSDEAEIMQNYAYVYKYDARNCCIAKRMPGADWTYMAYDNLKRLVLIQPGNLRAENQWFRIHYDALGNMTSRELVTMTQPLSLQEIYDYVATIDDCSQWIALVDAHIQSRTYPEIYTYGETDIPSELAFKSSELFDSSPAKSSCGLKNFEKLPVYGETATEPNPMTVTRAYYYDIYDRLIQQVEFNHLGGINRKRIQYNYVGKPIRISEEIQPGPGAAIDVKYTQYTYDKAMRVKSELTSVNGLDSVQINYVYDDAGRLISRNSGNIEERYDYNIRNWKTSQQNDWFDMYFSYDQPHCETSKPYYGGNISEIAWRHLTPGDSLSSEHTYAFSYDDLSQLKDTKHFVNGVETSGFVETGLRYDLNGNITSLSRSDADSLSVYKYTYNGNKLVQVEQLSAELPAIIDDSSGIIYHYAYDLNGNMTHDGRRNLDVEYNVLNLPEKVCREGMILVNYRYLSDGTKLSCLDSQGEGYEYLGSLVYERKGGYLRLESTLFSGGHFVAAQTDSPRMLALHHISDHLGSTRVVVDSCGVVRERNDYYAFGKRWDDPDRPVSDNRYLFNGKEAQIIGATGWLDYGARMYDPELGRWFVPDPLAEVYYGTSSYAYVRNNPILRIDPNGMWDEDPDPQNEKIDREIVDMENPIVVVGRPKKRNLMYEINTFLWDSFTPGLSFANEAGNAWTAGNYGIWAGWIAAGTMDMLTAGTGTKIKGVMKAGRLAAKSGMAKYTARNFRSNLIKQTGIEPIGKQAHHVLPQQFKKFFYDAGLNINDPHYGVWLDATQHLKGAKQYNRLWGEFFDRIPSPTQDEIFQQADEIMKYIYK